MSLLISRVAAGWRTEQIRMVYGVGTEMTATAASPVVFTPPVRAYVRGISAVIDTGDPMVAAGGALNMNVGIVENGIGIAALVIGINTFATWNAAGGRGFGWRSTAIVGTIITAPALSPGMVLFPANTLWTPGETQGARSLVAFTDVGTATGTMLFTLQWQPYT